MKKFIKENWFKLTIIFIIVIIATGLFYWREYRPSEIRKKCNNQILSYIGNLFKKHPNSLEGFMLEQKMIDEDYEVLYQRCLRENGL